MLSQIRRDRFPDLMATASEVTAELANSRVRFVMAGRLKRDKSIVRKLSRDANKGMDLSRMADLVGLRIITHDLKEQEKVLEAIIKKLDVDRVIDNRNGMDAYHRLHVICKTENGPLEVQIRTLLQHLWANESETFGEQAKEGKMALDVQHYLDEFSEIVKLIEWSGEPLKEQLFRSELGMKRRALNSRYEELERFFDDVTVTANQSFDIKTFVFVHDTKMNRLNSKEQYFANENEEALNEYDRLTRVLDAVRYDVLTLNCASQKGVRVTHPRLYSVI